MTCHKQTEDTAAYTADDVTELGDVVLLEALHNLTAEEYDADDDEGNRDLAALHVGDGREDDQHKYDSACAEQCNVIEEQKMENSGNDYGNQNHLKERFAAVLLFNKGTKQQDISNIPGKMRPVCVTDGITETAHVSQRIQPASAIDAEQLLIGPAFCDVVQKQ